jgi:Na+/H+ antiporter
MENYVIVIFILAVMIGLSAVADKIKLPYPIILITAGIAIGFIPDLPHIELAPEIVLLIFLPPLLYDAAFNISFDNFKTHFSTISTLAITLVFVTTTAIAVTAYYLIPDMTWPLAFLLGAILSATDAVSAISITKGLGISHKTTTILEGESLINDASALVAYRFALAAVTGTAFVFWKATIQFALLIGGGMLVGVVLGKITSWILNYVQKNSQVTVSLLILMPLVTYLVAEELHVSGVIAVVILGLGIARFSSTLFHEQLQQQSKSIWEIIVFLLNGLIFILIGLQLPYLLDTIEDGQLLPYIGYAFLINLVALLLRTAWVFLQRRNLLKAFSLKNEKRRVTKDALLDFKSSLIISWSGMRGIVSLAIAIGLPTHLQNGEPFPHRTAIIFISLIVVLFTIIGQGMTLPMLVKRLGIKEE